MFFISKSSGVPPKRAGTSNAKFQPGLHEAVDVRTDVLRSNDFLRNKIVVNYYQKDLGTKFQ